MIMPMVSFSISIFNKKHKSQTKQNALQQKDIETQKREHLNNLETHLEKAIRTSTSARIRFGTEAKNIKQAKDAEDVLIKSYETGTIIFNFRVFGTWSLVSNSSNRVGEDLLYKAQYLII